MRKSEQGFSHVIVLAVFVAVAVVGSGYLVYLHQQKTGQVNYTMSTPPKSSKSASTATSGTPSLAVPSTQASSASGVGTTINSLATSLNTSEKSLDSQYNANDQTSDASVGSAATSVGGAYDASNY